MDADASELDDAEQSLKREIDQRARALGFDVVGIALPDDLDPAATRFSAFLDQGMVGDMQWLQERSEWRRHPKKMWPACKSIIMLGANYGPATDPLALQDEPKRGVISVYARNKDYHDVLKGRLKQLGGWLHGKHDAEIKVFVDTAPVLEKPLAEMAGLGWQGKHTNLVSGDFGSWLFLGAIFTDLDIAPDARQADQCGSCHACLDVCPTNAFPAPYQLDPRRCISYLTIEHKGHILEEFRKPMANRIYGCDDCLSVCPWNKYAEVSKEAAFHPRMELTAPLLTHLAGLSDAEFRQVFSGSPVKRIGRDRFVRNVLIALGNSGDRSAQECIEVQLHDPSPLVRAMAVWALSQLLGKSEFTNMRDSQISTETDPDVLTEWGRIQ